MNRFGVVVRIAIVAGCLWIASCVPGSSGDAPLKIGMPASDFALQTVNHRLVKLSDLKGSVVLLDFWATWCPPCQASLPNLNQLSADPSLAARGLKVFAVNAQEDPQTVQAFLLQNNLTLPVLLDPDGAVNLAYQATDLPTTVLIGRDGLVKYATAGFSPETSEAELGAAIEKAMSENAK